MADLIFHLTAAADYQAVPPGEPYRPTGLAADGFIHCTGTLPVLLEVANRFYRDQPGAFVVLDIDPPQLTAPVRLESPVPPAPAGSPLAGVLFPHIYGPLNREAIVAVRPARRAADGRFLSV